MAPLEDFVDIEYSYTLNFITPTQWGSSLAIRVSELAQKLANKLNGTEHPFASGVGLFSFSSPQQEELSQDAGMGEGSITAISFDINYTVGGMTAKADKCFLDGIELPYIRKLISLEKSGASNNISGISGTKSLSIKQTRYYEFELPFDSTNEACVQLQKDILEGSLNKTYELKFYDGVNYTEESPLITTVSLFRSSNVNSQRKKVTEFSVTFTDFDKVQTTGRQYYLALINNPFDDSSVNCRYFSSQTEQKAWYNTMIIRGAKYEQIQAPNINNLIITQQVYLNNSINTLTELLQMNYAVIKVGTPRSTGFPSFEAVLFFKQINGYFIFNDINFYPDWEIYYNPWSLDQPGPNFVLKGTPITNVDNLKIGIPYYSIYNGRLMEYILRWRESTSSNVRSDYYEYRISETKTNTAEEEFYYYFIQSASVGAENQILLDLKLDTIQTYYFNPAIKIADCMILRAHLNRWIDNGDGTVSFDGRPESALFNMEQSTESAKRLTKNTRVIFDIDNTSLNSLLNNWFENNIIGWQYIYTLNKIKTYNNSGTVMVENVLKQIRYFNNEINTETFIINTGLDGILNCFCFPIYKITEGFGETNVIQFTDTNSNNKVFINSEGLDAFKFLNNDATKIIAIKFSIMPPFRQLNYSLYQILENNNLSFTSYGGTNQFYSQDSFVSGIRMQYLDAPSYGLINVSAQNCQGILSREYNTNVRLTFNVEEFYNSPKNYDFNPKLLSSNYRSIELTYGGQRFTYDQQKLNKSNFKVMYTEALTPDITRGYARIYTESNAEQAIYIHETIENYTGLTFSVDNSLIVENSQMAITIANNKNFFLQKGFESNVRMFNGFIDSFNTFFKGPLISSVVNNYLEYKRTEMSIDNLKHAPNVINNVNGNAPFNFLVNANALYIEEYDILPKEKEIINDYMFMNGFTYNKIDNVKNYDNIRHYFNFVQAIIDTISGIPISNDARRDIKERFANGIRFWNSDNVQYNLENYERWLNDV